jgi:ABC-type transport system involved in multi-copper enzyme maturation permease subunit
LVLSTAPLVSVCVWLPGIDPYEVAGLYVLLVSVAACFGMIGLACSIFLDRTQSALGITYLAVLPLAGVLLLFAYIFDPFFVLAVALWPAGVLLLATIVLYQACLKRLREPFDPVYRAADDEEAADQTGLVLTRDRFPDNLLAPARNPQPLADGGNPVYQKELRCEIFGRGTLFLRLVIQVSLFLSVVFLPFLFLGWEYVLVDYLVVFTMLVAPAFSCNAFTQERERGTLDLLLTSLVTPRQIVNGKFLACLRLSLFLCGLASVTLLFYLLVGGAGDAPHARSMVLRGGDLLVYVLIIGATIIFETALGLFCSLVCRTTFQSMVATYTTVLVVFGVPMAAQALLLIFAKGMSAAAIARACFMSPFQAVHSVAPKIVGSGGALAATPVVWPAYVPFALCTAAVLWGYVHTQFERWARRAPQAR